MEWATSKLTKNFIWKNLRNQLKHKKWFTLKESPFKKYQYHIFMYTHILPEALP
jgi:hypothetical protein